MAGGRLAAAGVAALTDGAAVAGATKGLSGQNFADQFYDVAMGNPDYDRAVFGTDVSPTELLMPIFPSINPGRIRTAQYGAPGMRSGIPRLLAGYRSGLINGTTVKDMTASNSQPLENNLAYSNTPPRVDGSIVFGQYNARYGR